MPASNDRSAADSPRLILTLLMGLIAVRRRDRRSATLPILYCQLCRGHRAELAASRHRRRSDPVVAVLHGAWRRRSSVSLLLPSRNLRRIVDSVSARRPVRPDQRRRLRHMAWLALGMQAVLIAGHRH